MKIIRIGFTALLLLIGIGVALLIRSNIPKSIASPESTKENIAAQEIAEYKNWTRVNAEPVLLDARIALMCAPPFPTKQNDNNPHKEKFITVYVNTIGRKAMMTEMNPQFPQGSVIVKEKLTAKNSATPELLTAMMKREKGFNPPGNDWEFLALSGDAKSIQAQGKLANCISCHTAKRSSDFVFRNYLSNNDLMKLKD
jgi:hypothetical protein